MGVMWPKESAEKMTKVNLQLILERIEQWKKVKRSALLHNLQTIVDSMERADLLCDD